MSQWFVRGKGQMYGPMNDGQLKQLADNRQISRTTEVAQSADGPWHPAASVDGLFGAAAPVETPRTRSAAISPPPRRNRKPDEQSSDARFSASDDGRVERTKAVRAEDSTRASPSTEGWSSDASDAAGAIAALRSRFDSIRSSHFLSPSGILDIFDWRFKKYLTPWILRVTWIIVLVLATLGITYQFILLMGTWLPDLGWNADDGGGAGGRFPDEFDRDPVLPWWLRIRFAQSLLRLSVVLGSILAVLWIRVVLELAIVLFNIATSLTSIERLIDDKGAPRSPP